MLIGIFHRFKLKGKKKWCASFPKRGPSSLPGNEDAFKRHSPFVIIQELLFYQFCWPCSSVLMQQPTSVRARLCSLITFLIWDPLSFWALTIEPVSETVLSWFWEDGEEKRKVCGASLHRIFLHIFLFQELHMYRWRIFHTTFIFVKGILLFNPPQWKKIFHLHLLHKFLFW